MEELLKLVKENNQMLKQIIQYINLKESDDYQKSNDLKEFMINVFANGIVGFK